MGIEALLVKLVALVNAFIVLFKKGKSVEVLSRRRHEAAGFVAAGMLAPHAEGLQGNLLALGKASLNQIPNWVKQIEKDSGIDCGLRNCGIVVPS